MSGPAARDPREQMGGFAAYLRAHGFVLGHAEVGLMLTVAAALPAAQWPRLSGLWRSVASGCREEWLRYPELHQAYWFPERVRGSTRLQGHRRAGRSLRELVEQLHQHPPGSDANAPATAPTAQGWGQGAGGEPGGLPRGRGGASRTDPLHGDPPAGPLQAEDLDRFEPVVEAVRRRLRRMLTRRWDASAQAERPHLRRSLRAAQATGGELVRLAQLRRRRRLPRVVMMVDVSRSMEAHALFFLRLARAFVQGLRARAFAFHTRLVEVTPWMGARNDRVQEKVRAVSFGFGGGTRIASCLHEALRSHLRRQLGAGDLFLVFSDGYDTDPPEALAEALAAVRRRGARVLWLHPTREPAASLALQAARAHIEAFVPLHDWPSLLRLPQALAGHGGACVARDRASGGH